MMWTSQTFTILSGIFTKQWPLDGGHCLTFIIRRKFVCCQNLYSVMAATSYRTYAEQNKISQILSRKKHWTQTYSHLNRLILICGSQPRGRFTTLVSLFYSKRNTKYFSNFSILRQTRPHCSPRSRPIRTIVHRLDTQKAFKWPL